MFQKNLVKLRIFDKEDDAEKCKDLLESNDISAEIKPEDNHEKFAVIISEDLLKEARIIMASQEAYDDLYNFTIDDKERNSNTE